MKCILGHSWTFFIFTYHLRLLLLPLFSIQDRYALHMSIWFANSPPGPRHTTCELAFSQRQTLCPPPARNCGTSCPIARGTLLPPTVLRDTLRNQMNISYLPVIDAKEMAIRHRLIRIRFINTAEGSEDIQDTVFLYFPLISIGPDLPQYWGKERESKKRWE